ncbi:MAG: hypothetical protein KBC64_01210 [Simkaniaceae bacterium]|nr:hypothetical protein [Simkaniaceae bacterium]
MKRSIFVILSFFYIMKGEALLDFHEKTQSFIVEEKQIVIPGYPDAFNPSLVRWHDGRLLLSFRARDSLNSTHLMGFIWLNENFEPEGKASLLSIHEAVPLKVSRAQDPRILKVGDEYYIAYNNILNDKDLETRRMLLTRLYYLNGHFHIFKPIYLLNFFGDKKNWIEKNWAPFDFEGSLFFSYSLNPHRVFKPALPTGACETVACTLADISWKWGELRGGTPALRDGDHYLGFFHSFKNMATVQSNGKKIAHYFMGAYRFKGEFPFALTHISPEPVVGATFYSGPDYPTWKPLKVVFPGGIIFDEKHVWVVYGKQDYETWVVKMDKQGLMDSLVEVKNEISR